ncbi:hypothetical protein ACGFIV_01005 [Sphaerisporangium sp. NPDC049003]|uniref:hypothetical protein n=1 Tax=Sphaerisporangium sp. NPDC049003 TaxID=3364517 RepID=UPI003724C03D
MARLGRGYPVPTRIIAPPRAPVNATIRPVTIHVVTRFHRPGITAETPNATIRPRTIHVATRFHPPGITAVRSVTIRPVTIHVVTRFHAPRIPALPGVRLVEEGQLEYRGLLMGAGTPYELIRLSGLDETPSITSGNVRRPDGHGSMRGAKTAEERVVTAELKIADHISVAQLPAVLDQLRAATPINSGETPLAIRLNGRVWLTSGEVISRPIGHAEHRELTNVRPLVQWVCSDPVLYSPQLHQAQIAPGTVAVAGNSGNSDSRPQIIFPGPVVNPVLTHVQTGRRVGLNLDIPPGQFVTVDCEAGTLLLNGDVDVLPARAYGSVPPRLLVIPPGGAALSYATVSGTAAAFVLWRDATL